MKQHITYVASLFACILSLSSPAMAADAKHCIKFENNTIANTCWEKVSVSWCYSKHDNPAVRCNTAPGERRFTQDVELEGREQRAIAEPTASTSIPYAACEGSDSIEVGAGQRNTYSCKDVPKREVSLSLDL